MNPTKLLGAALLAGAFWLYSQPETRPVKPTPPAVVPAPPVKPSPPAKPKPSPRRPSP